MIWAQALGARTHEVAPAVERKSWARALLVVVIWAQALGARTHEVTPAVERRHLDCARGRRHLDCARGRKHLDCARARKHLDCARAGPRLIRLGSSFSPRVSYAIRGLPAGDIFNDCFVKCFAQEEFQAFSLRHPLVTLDSYVDDDTLACEADTEEEVLVRLTAAAADLEQVLVKELEVDVSYGKGATVASSPGLLARLVKALGKMAGAGRQTTPNLGVDFCTGGRRSMNSNLAVTGRWRPARDTSFAVPGRLPPSRATTMLPLAGCGRPGMAFWVARGHSVHPSIHPYTQATPDHPPTTTQTDRYAPTRSSVCELVGC